MVMRLPVVSYLKLYQSALAANLRFVGIYGTGHAGTALRNGCGLETAMLELGMVEGRRCPGWEGRFS